MSAEIKYDAAAVRQALKASLRRRTIRAYAPPPVPIPKGEERSPQDWNWDIRGRGEPQ